MRKLLVSEYMFHSLCCFLSWGRIASLYEVELAKFVADRDGAVYGDAVAMYVRLRTDTI